MVLCDLVLNSMGLMPPCAFVPTLFLYCPRHFDPPSPHRAFPLCNPWLFGAPRFAAAAKPLNAAWNDPLVRPHTAAFGAHLAAMRVDELDGVSLSLELLKARVVEERAQQQRLVEHAAAAQAKLVSRQGSAASASSAGGAGGKALTRRQSSGAGEARQSLVMDPKFLQQLSPQESAQVQAAFKNLDKDGNGERFFEFKSMGGRGCVIHCLSLPVSHESYMSMLPICGFFVLSKTGGAIF